MKIIYLHQYFNTPEMSGGTRSYEMARRMVAAGHDVHMVTSYREKKSDKQRWFQTDEAGVKVHWYPVPYSNHMGFFQRVKAFFAFALASRKKAGELDGDIVFATSTPLTIALPAVSVSRKKKIPMVFEVRDLWPEMPIAIGAIKHPLLRYMSEKLEHWAYRNSSAVVALSPGMKQGVVDTGYPATNVAVIPNSSDNSEFQHDPEAAKAFRDKRSWLGDKPLLVYTGTFGRVNGVGYMVNLAVELKKIGSDVRILLVGDGQERPSVIEGAKEAGVYDDNLFFEPNIPKREMPTLLSAATMASSLFIDLPEMRSNSANKFFDALASGTPILLNYGGWMHDLVNSHGCGLAMWKCTYREVAVELDNKMHDTEWLVSAGDASRRLAETKFDRDVLARQLITVLESAVNDHPERAESIASGHY